jgi:glycosyltransferase involved in cell wall biosynthesis
VSGLVNTGKYSFRCFGAAVKHDNYDTVVVNPDFVIKPTNGFGDKMLLRKTLAQVKPDALMLFTDPRFFIWVWEMEDEIHQICPIVYWHLWDNPPWPEFNRPLYESTDLINCINYPTYEMVSERFPEKTNYIPHAVPEDLYRPLPKEESMKLKESLLGKERLDHFTCLYVSRNARRKMTSDILQSWKMFLEELEKREGHKKATLVMHTDPLDPEGTNLFQVMDLLGIKNNVVFSKDRIGFQEMKSLYNVCDTIVNRSCNEGFGLPTLEAMMCGKPIIAIKTGGLTRQVENPDTGEQYGIALEPEVKTMIGNHMVPYIYEDFVSHKTTADAYMKMYLMGPEERERIGLRAMERARREYNVEKMVKDWDVSLTKTIDSWKSDSNVKWKVTEL